MYQIKTDPCGLTYHKRLRMNGFSKIRALFLKFGSKAVYAAAAVLVCIVAAVVFLVGRPEQQDTSVTAQSADSSSQTEKSATQTQTHKLGIINFKKAQLSEYDMIQTEKQDSGEDSTANDPAPEEQDPSGFKVQAATKDFSYSDTIPRPAHFSTTRNTSSEFFTVRDITTGKIVTMNAYELVCSIVYNEVGDGWGSEAIKAQAVAAYSCLRYMDSIGMIETVGIKRNYTGKIESCVRAVQGQVVTYNGSIANTLYSASTAGYTLPSNMAIVSSYPYLKCVRSAYDSADPNWGIKSSFSKQEVRRLLEKEYGVKLSDNVKNWFRLTDVRYGKYVFGVSIDAKKNTTGKSLQKLFKLRSNAFEISFANDRFIFRSYGWGHGVGMSQWGACMYARHGYTYDQILAHYYVNTRINISKESAKAVARGKKSQQELELEAQTASQTTTAAAVPTGDETTADTKQSERATTTTKSSADDQDSGMQAHTQQSSQSEQTSAQTTQADIQTTPEQPQQTESKTTGAANVTKSAEDAE